MAAHQYDIRIIFSKVAPLSLHTLGSSLAETQLMMAQKPKLITTRHLSQSIISRLLNS